MKRRKAKYTITHMMARQKQQFLCILSYYVYHKILKDQNKQQKFEFYGLALRSLKKNKK